VFRLIFQADRLQKSDTPKVDTPDLFDDEDPDDYPPVTETCVATTSGMSNTSTSESWTKSPSVSKQQEIVSDMTGHKKPYEDKQPKG
jgi:hypothetical protein